MRRGGRSGHVLFALSAALVAASVMLTGCASDRGGDGDGDLKGDLDVHDPALARDGNTWFAYSTGTGAVKDGNIPVRSSLDGQTWTRAGFVWDEKPSWLSKAVPGVDNLWAPELVEHDDTWYLYYSASTFGSQTSTIALATNTTLDPEHPDYEWVDQGPVIASTEEDDYNAIDPGIAVDGDGTPWMAFGSFWSGIRMVELEWPSGLRADDDVPLRIADRGAPPNAVEAPHLVEHDGQWFLFMSWDSCCRALDSTYRIAVGRADTPQGPFVDREGVPLLDGGGTVLLESDGDRIGPGGQSVYDGVMALHYYDATLNGQPQLELTEIVWEDGWPTLSW